MDFRIDIGTSRGADDKPEDAAVGVNPLIADARQPTIGATLDVQQRFAEDVVRKST